MIYPCIVKFGSAKLRNWIDAKTYRHIVAKLSRSAKCKPAKIINGNTYIRGFAFEMNEWHLSFLVYGESQHPYLYSFFTGKYYDRKSCEFNSFKRCDELQLCVRQIDGWYETQMRHYELKTSYLLRKKSRRLNNLSLLSNKRRMRELIEFGVVV